uniref:Uncharacterized protein n=1 Tax=Timema douglasi TaxID=61478 RepID=A0A7R8VL75_TIMDO|nr:unnamed protein product [Timema douglasi]
MQNDFEGNKLFCKWVKITKQGVQEKEYGIQIESGELIWDENCIRERRRKYSEKLLRRKKTTVRKYGILASREDMEMTPLGAEEDDDDTTLFDVNNHSRQ